MNLFEELMAVVSALDAAGVEYALVGGLAVAVWGAPRATKDIDLLVLPASVANALDAVEPRGFDLKAHLMTFRDGMRLQRVTRAEPPELLTLDLILAEGHLRPAWESRVKLDTTVGPIWVVSRDALIEMKAAAGRPQDIADIERLKDLDR